MVFNEFNSKFNMVDAEKMLTSIFLYHEFFMINNVNLHSIIVIKVKNKRHVLVLSSWYPNRIETASGSFIRRFALLLSTRFQITVIFVRADNSIKQIEVVENHVGNLHEIILYYPKPKGLLVRSRQLAKYKQSVDLALTYLKEKPDLIHAHVSYPKGKEFEYVAKKLNIDYILSEHSSDFSENERKKWSKIKKQLIVGTLRKARMVLPVSSFLEQEMLRVEPHFARVVLPLPVNTSLFYPEKQPNSSRPYTFIHVSGLDEKFKNVKGIVEAFYRVHQHQPNTKLVIVTDGDASEIKQFISKKECGAGIEIKQDLPHEKVALEYRNSDCFVLFSEFETYSCVLVEALASGIQIITTNVGVVKSLENNLVTQVPNGDIHALATSMEELSMGKRTVDKNDLVNAARSFSDEHILDRISMIYNEVLLKTDD
jgi:L-malate glycosyltransferase